MTERIWTYSDLLVNSLWPISSAEQLWGAQGSLYYWRTTALSGSSLRPVPTKFKMERQEGREKLMNKQIPHSYWYHVLMTKLHWDFEGYNAHFWETFPLLYWQRGNLNNTIKYRVQNLALALWFWDVPLSTVHLYNIRVIETNATFTPQLNVVQIFFLSPKSEAMFTSS